MGRRERRDEKRKRRNLIISLFFIFLMVFGFTLAGVVMNNPNPGSGESAGGSLKYEGYKFDVSNNYYTLEINGQEKRFFYFPTDVQTIQVPQQAITDLKGSDVITFAFNPNIEDVQTAELARYQLNTNLDKVIYSALTQNSTEYNFPVVSCADANPQNPVIYLNQSNTTGIDYANGCVKVRARGPDILRASERLMYIMLGVMNG